MNANVRRQAKIGVCAISCVMAVSCTTPPSAPQQVGATNPTVTYKYRNDDQLMEASDRAAEYCSLYQAVPQSIDFGEDRDGRYVVFGCMARTPGQYHSPFDPDLTYRFRTDRELTAATRDAQMYCRDNTGSARVASSISNGPNGTKMARFQCRPR